MKITKTANDVQAKKDERRKANDGCFVCPCCGETKSNLYYNNKALEEGRMPVSRGILVGLQKSKATWWFGWRYWKIDCYSCLTCGAEWESEPYEVGEGW